MNIIKWRCFLSTRIKGAHHKIADIKHFGTNNRVNHYDCLGVTPSATIGEIKTAYYKLSMIYHPDKNKGVEASEKFRDINTAYEVLGNYKLKRLYDKGMLGHSGVASAYSKAQEFEEEVEDDPQTKFYKARMKRNEAPHASGRQPIYNFDEWSKSHYGVNLDRHLKAKRKLERTIDLQVHNSESVKKEALIFGVVCGVLIFMYFDFLWREQSYDQVVPKNVASTSAAPEGNPSK